MRNGRGRLYAIQDVELLFTTKLQIQKLQIQKLQDSKAAKLRVFLRNVFMAHQQMNIQKNRATSKDESPIRRKLGATIRDFRLMLRMTPNELAWDAGETEVFISQLEAGEIDVEISALKRIADALQIELSELMLSAEQGHRPILLTDDGR